MFVLAIYYLFTALFFILPILSVTLFVIYEGQFHFGFIFLFALFGVLGFFLLRSSLWNSAGKEILVKNGSVLEYIADYNWFKDKSRVMDLNGEIRVSIEPHYNDGMFKLVIVSDKEEVIETAVPLDNEVAKGLKEQLDDLCFNHKKNA